MPVYVVALTSGIVKAAAERSPRVAIVTDVPSAKDLNPAVRSAGDAVLTGDLTACINGEVPEGFGGALVWLEGEQLLSGATADLRHAMYSHPARTSVVAVHLPGVTGADLISLQPRAIPASAQGPYLNLSWRVAGAVPASETVLGTLRQIDEPWARLYLALLREQKRQGDGIEALKRIWREKNLEPRFASLVLRNLIVVLIRRRDWDKAEELLILGLKAYPAYAELHYLSGVMWTHRSEPSKAIRCLEQATRIGASGFVGSGGERSYRTHWLLGTICDLVGEQEKAVRYYVPGVNQRPAFAPSVEALLKLRLGKDRAEVLQQPLCEMARREPQYLEATIDFLLRHSVFDPARRLIETMPLVPETRETLQQRLASAESRFRPRPVGSTGKLGVVLQGPLFVHSGHARINRELGLALMRAKELDASLEPHGYASVHVRTLAHGELLWQGVQRKSQHSDVTVRHQWPPDFRRPRAGKLVCVLPWEHRAVPHKWVEEIQRNVDELWVPSNFVRSAFVEGGVDGERVQVVPNGISSSVFASSGPAWRPTGCREFGFLFVGGTIRRKGLDLLVRAYVEAFSPDDDVTLVIKDAGAASFYQHNTVLPQMLEFARQSRSPHILVLSEEYDDAKLASLYRGCDALVLPYRGEGFGMPIAEAMACGKPVITTALGPSQDFCSPQTEYLIPAEEVEVPDPPPPLGGLSSQWTWFEPDLGELARTMLHVYHHRDEAARRGAAAADRIRKTHDWSRITPIYLQRLFHLTGKESGCEEREAVTCESTKL